MESNDFTTGKISKQIRLIAIPASVGFFFNTMYNVVDTYFAGFVSTDALAALSLSFPVFFIIIAFGFGISTGATALIANELGRKNNDEARLYALQAMSFSVVVGLMLTVIGYYISPFLFNLLGASGDYLNLSITYIDIILLASVFFILAAVINGILNARGDTKTYRNFLIVGFFLNIILNPVLMFGWFGFPAMGLAGVAWATFVIQVFGVVYMLRAIYHDDILCKSCFHMFVPRLKYIKNIAGQGFPASLNMMTIALGIFIITYFIAPFGKVAVAAYGIATRIDQLALLPSMGLNIATLTLIGQNNGAMQYERCKEVYRKVTKYGIFISTIGMIGVFFFAKPLMHLFSEDLAVVDVGAYYLKISILVYWAYIILYISTSALQGLKKPNFAIWIGLYRQIVAPVVIFYLFSTALGWGLSGIWWGIFTINWTATIISIWYVRRVMRRIFKAKM